MEQLRTGYMANEAKSSCTELNSRLVNNLLMFEGRWEATVQLLKGHIDLRVVRIEGHVDVQPWGWLPRLKANYIATKMKDLVRNYHSLRS